MKIALAMIVRGSESEAKRLATGLQFVAPYVDKVFITLTQPSKEVEEVADFYNAEVSHFEWCNDFSAARNFNFSQVPKEYDYILWMDADDAIRGMETLKDTIEAHPDTDVFVMNYLYAFDEFKNPVVVHPKSQIVKNDGCVTWAGPLHEDFKENRTVTRHLLKGIERIHLSDDTRFQEAKERNLEVAKHQLKLFPSDPRSYWNVGNSLKALGKNEEAVKQFDIFLNLSRSDDEKYIVRLRKAECYWALGESNKAIDEARYGIGTKPNYPDAYHLLGSLYLETRRFMEAIEVFLQGMVKKPPYTSIIVYNPRDYDYVPLKNLAKCFLNISRPDQALVCLQQCLKIQPKDDQLRKTIKMVKKEVDDFEAVTKIVKKLSKVTDKVKLKAALEEIPDKYKAHPGVCNLRNVNFIKEESSGKDLAVFCGYTMEEWTPASVEEKGIGGSEEAIIWLTKLLAQKGWNITVYNNCGHAIQTFDGVTYKPFWMYNYRDKQDVTILWRATKPLDWEINCPKIYVDMHDVIPSGEFTEKRIARLTKVLVKSKFQRELFPAIPDDKILVIPNGIDAALFEDEIERDPYLLINTSTANRSLSTLLDCFREIKKQVPQAKLKWAYGWNTIDAAHGNDEDIMAWKKMVKDKMIGLDGFEELGRLSHNEVAKLYKQASIYAYPTGFGEIFCISAIKAQAAGCLPITTDFSALQETVKYGKKIHSTLTAKDWAQPGQFDFAMQGESEKKEFIKAVVETLNNPPHRESRQQMQKWACENFDWSNIANQWNALISE